jgi:uracil-DNA glycosylase family 4
VNDRQQQLDVLDAEVRVCPKCPLCRTRTKAVPGEGPVDAEIMFVGEGPGFHEDKQGRPFVGPAGRFLEELLNSIGLRRDQVYITNVVKCRPPENRDPAPGEITACAPYLDRQFDLIKPKIVVTLGRFSMARFFPGQSITRIHGQPKHDSGRIVFPLFHPAAGLRSPDVAEMTRQDMRRIPALLEEAKSRAAAPVAKAPVQAPAAVAVSPATEESGPTQLSLF